MPATLYIFIYMHVYIYVCVMYMCICMYILLMAFFEERREQVRLLVVSSFEQELYFLSVLTYAAKQVHMIHTVCMCICVGNTHSASFLTRPGDMELW